MDLTDTEILFLKHHKIPIEDVCDARNSSSLVDGRKKAKGEGKHFMLVEPPCRKGGHRLYSRSKHCIQCDTSHIQRQKIGSKTGYIYIAGSKEKKLMKVGFTTDMDTRERFLNSQKCALVEDWLIIKWIKVDNAGGVEVALLQKLAKYESPQKILKEGEWQDTKETFSCSFKTALSALEQSSAGSTIIKEKPISLEFFKDYCAFPDREGDGFVRKGNTG